MKNIGIATGRGWGQGVWGTEVPPTVFKAELRWLCEAKPPEVQLQHRLYAAENLLTVY